MAKITYNRGTTFTFTHVYKINGVAATSGQKLFFTVKPQVDDDSTDANAIVKKTITMTGSSTVVTINPTDVPVSVNDDAGPYVYDIKIQDTNLGLILVAADVFELNVTATNRVS